MHTRVCIYIQLIALGAEDCDNSNKRCALL